MSSAENFTQNAKGLSIHHFSQESTHCSRKIKITNEKPVEKHSLKPFLPWLYPYINFCTCKQINIDDY